MTLPDDAYLVTLPGQQVGTDVEYLVVSVASAEEGKAGPVLVTLLPSELKSRTVLFETQLCVLQLGDDLVIATELSDDLPYFLGL